MKVPKGWTTNRILAEMAGVTEGAMRIRMLRLGIPYALVSTGSGPPTKFYRKSDVPSDIMLGGRMRGELNDEFMRDLAEEERG